MTADRDAAEQQQQSTTEPESREQQRRTVRDAERFMAGTLSENTLVTRIRERLTGIPDA